MKQYCYRLFFLTLLLLGYSTLMGIAADRTVKVLAIGNSFSEDAIEQYFAELAEASGKQVIVANLFHPGCSLERHINNLHGDVKDYNYRKIIKGIKVDTPNITLKKALLDEDWDYVSIQQASHFSGQFETYNPYITELHTYIRSQVRKDTKIMLHMTWAYPQYSDHGAFKNYGNSQKVMYEAIIDATCKIQNQEHFDLIIPCGTAIQNARTSKLGDTLNRDGYHLNLLYGRYTAACTWYEIIFGESVLGNKYIPFGMSEYQKSVAQNAAHYAVKSPFKVTDLSQIIDGFVKKAYVTSTQDTLLYRLLIPETMESGRKYPLVLFLHGAGERGNDNEKQLIHGGQMWLNPVNREKYPAFVLFPQCPTNRFWAYEQLTGKFLPYSMPIQCEMAEPLEAVKELLDQYLSMPNIDCSKVYIIGLSMGAMGTFDMVARFPDIFAAAVPICGTVNPQRLSAAKDVNFRIFHGDADNVVPVEGSREAYKALKATGASVEYIEFPGCNHGSWNPAFNYPDFMEWLFRQKKK